MRLAPLFGAAALLPLVSSCFAISNLDRFHVFPSDNDDLRFTMTGLTPHVNQMFELFVVDTEGFIQSRVRIDPTGTENLVFNAPGAVPLGQFHLDFYADVNGSGAFDGITSAPDHDHAWRLPVQEKSPGLYDVSYTHNLSFTDINVVAPAPKSAGSGDTVLHFKDLADLEGKLVEVRVIDNTGHTTALYRAPHAAARDVTMPGTIDTGVPYTVTVYADANGNGVYDDPSKGAGDLGLSLSPDPGAKVEVTIDRAALTGGQVAVGAP